MKFESKYEDFHWRTCIWKYQLQNCGHFVSASMCYSITSSYYRQWQHSSHSPAGTRRNNNVFTTSTRRRVDVVKTLSLRLYCVMWPLGQDITMAIYKKNPGLVALWLVLYFIKLAAKVLKSHVHSCETDEVTTVMSLLNMGTVLL